MLKKYLGACGDEDTAADKLDLACKEMANLVINDHPSVEHDKGHYTDNQGRSHFMCYGQSLRGLSFYREYWREKIK